MSELEEKRAAAMKVREERKVKFAEQKALEDAKRLKEATEKFEAQRKEEEAREKEAAALAARKEAERLQILEGIRVREEGLIKKAEEEKALKAEKSKKEQEAKVLATEKAKKDAETAAEVERIGKLWVEVYNSRGFKHASPNAKILISKENPDGLLDRLKDVRFLNKLELAGRANTK